MDLRQYKKELDEELKNIISYWAEKAIDHVQGGFFGRIDEENRAEPDAPKGSVLNARILWTFSAAYRKTQEPRCLYMARRAFDYIQRHFIDPQYGGVYWSVDCKGRPLDTRKQVYALAFVIYACSEYYQCCRDEKAKQVALELYKLIQQHSYDEQRGGYFEAFANDWTAAKDLRLSGKDANEKKTANTHLHILEAYTSLYQICQEPGIANSIDGLLHCFTDHFIDVNTGHLRLFFDEDWQLKSGLVSYGHDIEASWLLLVAAETTGNAEQTIVFSRLAIQMAAATTGAIDQDGGLWYEYEPATGIVKEKHWWPQAEAMIGFFNAWQNTGEERFLHQSIQSWEFVKNYLLDKLQGEWYWGITENHSRMQGQDKAGPWKCPYHNARACMEISRRIGMTGRLTNG